MDRCACAFEGHGGKALMSVDALSRIGLERCATARCAIQTMGDVAVQYGYYGAGSFEGSAESLMVIDPNEGAVPTTCQQRVTRGVRTAACIRL